MNTPPLHHSRRKRSHREWLALLLVLVAAAGLLGAMLWHDHRITSATERDRLEVQARVVDEYLEQLLGGVSNALQGVRDELPSGVGPDVQDRAGRRLKVLTEAMPGVRFISVVDANGVIRANSIDDLVGEERSEREFFQSVPVRPEADRLYISEPYLGNRGVTSLLVARAMLDAEGRFDGLVYAKLDPDFFSVVLRSVLYADDMHSALVSQSGRLFLYVGEEAQAPNLNLNRPGSEFEQHLRSGSISNFYRGQAAASETESLMALRTIQPARLKVDRPLVIEVSRTVEATYQPWYQRLFLALILYVLLSAGALAGLYVFQRQRHVRNAKPSSRTRSAAPMPSGWNWPWAVPSWACGIATSSPMCAPTTRAGARCWAMRRARSTPPAPCGRKCCTRTTWRLPPRRWAPTCAARRRSSSPSTGCVTRTGIGSGSWRAVAWSSATRPACRCAWSAPTWTSPSASGWKRACARASSASAA